MKYITKYIFLILIAQWQMLVVLSKLRINLDQFEILTKELSLVLSACKKIEVNNIGVVTDSRTFVQPSLKAVPLININDVDYLSRVERDQNLHTFVVIPSTVEHLESTITKLERTTWWNPSALYVILDDNVARNGCKNARPFLKTAWNKDLLSSVFFCITENRNTEFRMYTFNPFTSRAPKSWQKIREGTNETNKNRDHSWTLFTRTFHPGRTTCGNLDFAKTGTLGGYGMKGMGLHNPPSLTIDPSKGSGGKLGGFNGIITEILLSKLNGSMTVTGITNDTRSYKFLHLVASGKYDVFLNTQYVFNKPNITTTYPHVNSGISILTRYPDNEAVYVKVLRFMNPVFILCCAVVGVITVIILEVFAGRGMIHASLEMIRVALNNSMTHFPEQGALRVYLITVFLLFMLTSSTFQSNLSSLLTSSIPRLTIDSDEELKTAGFEIYAYHGYRNAVFDDVLFTRVKMVDHWDCSEYVRKDRNVACAADRTTLLKIAFEKGLHLSKHRINTLFSAYVVRPNWPLKDRFTSMLLHLSETGLIDHWWEKVMAKYVHKWLKRTEKRTEDEKRNFTVMTLNDLDFAFYILAFGLFASALSFLIEISTRRLRVTLERREKNDFPIFPFTL